jgi:hypothetical protein
MDQIFFATITRASPRPALFAIPRKGKRTVFAAIMVRRKSSGFRSSRVGLPRRKNTRTIREEASHAPGDTWRTRTGVQPALRNKRANRSVEKCEIWNGTCQLIQERENKDLCQLLLFGQLIQISPPGFSTRAASRSIWPGSGECSRTFDSTTTS